MSHKDFINKLAYEHIIQQYLFVKLLEKDFSDEYIKTMYRIKPSSIRNQYNSIPVSIREIIEQDLKLQIEQGKLNLREKAKEWHRESFQESIKEKLNKETEELEGVDK